MLFKRPQHLRFEYIPRYYNPDKDEELKRKERMKRKLKFQRIGISERKRKSLLWWLIITGLVFYLYLMLSGMLK
ncbi:hypothetical protein JGI7_00431 [Candidatus Kryptonium thompsonii]|uniref:Uncharacterized protein n=1 Tax=Candidatus Kryptonium thompsonii TaxID=1633631 RepID=A0A0P1M449_9BACT|nr:hypothetical protein [Candidatus Kryptonium thompsoni]CUS79031.1 hypothetical protein JGI8_00273 [Candidatus Kryptonium thompsoni]CUS80675.1 hypothetical protein JGI7_00431 [Candidatus Kryptonium thompsoni]CUS86260.1 hypothetical protein JGI13_01293 [Candidatus Kryptonium thompsoni]CUS87293.1 hypothetical protein JGI6_01221 [Candidatus Kryptonium thompsoni]CUS87816.1 hypothetical protein JGI15_103813 [Candidatus Kryptonium thompsoni]